MRRAFTLLEVILALAILGVSLVSVLTINQQAVVSHLYAKRLTVATLLARSKMIDLEQKMHDDGLSVDDDEESGDFSDEGWSSYKWRAKIIAPKTNGLSPEQLFGAIFNLPLGGDSKGGAGGLGSLMGSLFGASGQGGAGGAPGAAGANGAQGGLLAAMGPMAGIASAQFTQMVDQLQKSVREVHLTVTWKEGKLIESVDLVTHVVSLGPGSDRNGGAAAAAGATATGGAGSTWVRSDTCQIVPNPVQAPNGTGMVDPRDNAVLITQAQCMQRTGGMQQRMPQ